MSTFDELLQGIQAADYPEKSQLLQYLMHTLKQIKRLTAEDQEAVTAYVCHEIDELLAPQGSNDRERWKTVRCGKYSYREYRV